MVRITAMVNTLMVTGMLLIGVAHAGAAPKPLGRPSLSGSPQVGQELQARAPRFRPAAVKLSWRWQRRSSSGWRVIAGAHSARYRLIARDHGRQLRVGVRARDRRGRRSTWVNSLASARILFAAPELSEAPVISGNPQRGQTLSVSPGRWSSSLPLSYSLQWQRCAALEVCQPIAGATDATYQPVTDDVARQLQVTVRASSSDGSSSAQSALSAAVTDPPTAQSPPSLPVPRVGELLAVQAGSWEGWPQPQLSYRWQRCNLQGQDCSWIAGATTSSYTPQVADIKHRLRVWEGASNGAGEAEQSSSLSEPAWKSLQGTIQEFELPAGSNPLGIGPGADGNLWFGTWGTGNIGRITLDGTVTFFPTPSITSNPKGIKPGPDGNMWASLAGNNTIARIKPDGSITEWPIPTPSAEPMGISAGEDGAIWFAEQHGDKIGRITTDGQITEYPLGASNTDVTCIEEGGDGNMWFTEAFTNKVGKITPAGEITRYDLPAGSNPRGVTYGPDGNVWYAGTGNKTVGKVSPDGQVTAYSGVSGFPWDIADGPDGNVWFTQWNNGKIGRITPSGELTEYDLPSGTAAYPQLIDIGADGNLWFTEFGTDRIGRFS